MISSRARLLKPSPTLAMADRARELAAKGVDVISLTVGEPDWPTLSVASEAGIQAIQKGKTKYTPAHGLLELRKAIRPWLLEETGINYSESEIVVGSGAKFVEAALFQMCLDPGDEVLIPSPYWVSYPVMVELAGGLPKIIDCGKATNFRLTGQMLDAAVTIKTKALVLCSPSNPTGLAYSPAELQDLASALRRHPHLLIFSDDIYNRLMFARETPIAAHLLKIDPGLRDRTVVINGASKSFSMTGWRVGWAAGPAAIMKPMADYFSQTTSNPCSISQHAALAALEHGRPELAKINDLLRERFIQNLPVLQKVPGLVVVEPQGAFYFWVNVSQWFGKTHGPSNCKTTGSKIVADVLLDHSHVATVPGVEFGSEGYLRLSFAIDDKRFMQAAQRMSDFAQQLR